jgi:hypothetical protein
MEMSIEHPNSFRSIAQCVKDLVAIKSALDSAGIDGMEYMRYLVKKGNRGDITNISDRINAAGNMFFDHTDTLMLIDGFKSNGIDTRERLHTISSLAQLIAAGLRIKGMNVNEVIKHEPPIQQEHLLRERFKEIYEYTDRHIEHAKNTGTDTCIDMDIARKNLSYCFAVGSNPKIAQVISEKNRAERGFDIKYNLGFERKFMEALGSAGSRAQYNYLKGSLDYIPKIAEFLTGIKVDGASIDEPTRKVIDGAFPYGDRISKFYIEELKEVLRIRFTNPSNFTEMVNKLPGNIAVRNAMARRGTDLDAIGRFEYRYRNFTKRSDTANAQIRKLHKSFLDQSRLTGLRNEPFIQSDPYEAAIKLLEYADRNRLAERDERFKTLTETAISIVKLNGIIKDDTHEIIFYCPTDPIERMQLGEPFEQCCLGLNRSNKFGAWQRGIDANNIIVYASEATGEDGRGRVIGRVSLVESDKGLLLSSQFMHEMNTEPFGNYEGWMECLSNLATETGRRIVIPSNILSDGAISKLAKTYRLKPEYNLIAHLDKAVCSRVYMEFRNLDNDSNVYMSGSGYTLPIAYAYVIEPKPKLRK